MSVTWMMENGKWIPGFLFLCQNIAEKSSTEKSNDLVRFSSNNSHKSAFISDATGQTQERESRPGTYPHIF